MATQQAWQDLIAEYSCGGAAGAARWMIDAGQPSDWWLSVEFDGVLLPQQGWKLHISACSISAEAVLRAVLPVLVAERVMFKVIRSRQRLEMLNRGQGGFSQIGKFITVYPASDAQAVRLAEQLHQVTQGMRGPAIPSDRPLLPGSLVYYRYGSFQHHQLQLPHGRLVPALRAPDGSLIPDRLEDGYTPPDWAIDPFLAAGVARDLPPMESMLAQRFIVLETLYQSASGAVARAIDLQTPRLCILKRAARDAAMSLQGHDARDRLQREATILKRLASTSLAPEFIDLIEIDAVSGDRCLVMEHIGGETLAAWIARHHALGQPIPAARLVAWGVELADVLAQLHEHGIVHGDITLNNVVVTPEQRVRVIDFNSAHELNPDAATDLFVTRGYCAPELPGGAPPSTSRDIYSLGALLYGLATGAEPALAPEPASLLTRPVRLLNPTIAPALEAVIIRCLEPDSHRRFRSMAALRAALLALAPASTVPAPAFGAWSDATDDGDDRRRWEQLARQVGDTICRELLPMPESRLTNVPQAPGFRNLSRNLYDGLAGTVVVLAALASAFQLPAYRSLLAELTDRLRAMPPPPGATVAGLYLGEAGVSAALLAAGFVLKDEALLTMAAQRGHGIAALPYASPTLLNGTAGRILLHLWLWDATGDRRQLDHAVAAGAALISAATPGAENEVYWTIPAGYGETSGHAYLGYALGAAGIADALLELFDVTGEERWLHTAQQAGQWIVRHAVSTLDDRGVTWPERIGKPAKGCGWYHGSGGIGRFLAHCHRLDCLPHADELAARAAYMVARGVRWADGSQAWGLAGNIELLLDLAQTQPAPYLAEARSLGQVLAAFAAPEAMPAQESNNAMARFAHSYMNGSAGLVLCFLRLAHPQRPPLLSRAGLRRLSAAQMVM